MKFRWEVESRMENRLNGLRPFLTSGTHFYTWTNIWYNSKNNSQNYSSSHILKFWPKFISIQYPLTWADSFYWTMGILFQKFAKKRMKGQNEYFLFFLFSPTPHSFSHRKREKNTTEIPLFLVHRWNKGEKEKVRQQNVGEKNVKPYIKSF